MRVIYKKISLEPLKSRMPSIIPAYDNNGKQHDFLHIVELSNNPIINYGMLPFNVQIINDEKLGEYSGVLFTYNQLVQKFHELDNIYYHNAEICSEQIEINENDKNFYDWLIENCFPYFLFNKELKDIESNKVREIIKYWNTNRLSIKEVIYWVNYLKKLSTKTECCYSNEFNKRGGQDFLDILKKWHDNYIGRIICDVKDYGHDFIYLVNDTDTSVTVKVLKTNNNNTKEITTHTFNIMEPRIKILGNNRYIRYGEIDKDGNVKNPINLEIIDNILTIPCLITDDLNPLIVSEPYISIPMTLNANIDNLGETQSIIEEWDDGYEYNKNIENQENIDYSGGVIINYNNDNWILKTYENSPGYLYSNKYKEIYFANVSGMTLEEYINYTDIDNELKDGYDNEEQWERIFNYLPKSNDLQLNTYTYKDNVLIINPTEDMFIKKYYININNDNGFCILNGIPYALFKIQYVNVNNVKYEVQYVYEYYNDKNELIQEKPYIRVNNSNVYLNDKYTIETKLCYMVNNNIIEYTSDNPKKYAYAYINNEYIFFEQNDLNGSTTPNGLTISEEDGDKFVILNEEFTVYNCDCVSGKTSSKLINLINTENLAIDNLGNKLNGVLPIIERDGNNGNKIYVNDNNLKTNDWIFIPYTPNYVFDIEEISDNVYWGDFIKSITFNYLLNNDEKNIKCEDVNTLKNTENEIHENISNISNITCEIEYYIGTLLTKNDNKYVLLLNDDSKYYGIKYIDNISLTHEQCLYYYTDFESCIINYLKLTPIVETYTNQTYNVPNISEEISYFEFNIKPFDLQYGFVDYYNLQNSIDYTQENITFYRVNLLDNFIDLTIESNKIQSKFYIKGVNKCFSFILPLNLMLYETYSYYYQINDIKYYATYENGKYVIKIDDDNIYVTDDIYNDFNLTELDENGNENKIPSPYNLYCEITIKLHLLQLSNTHDTYFDYKNNMTLTPHIYNENKIGMATPEKISGDIYIDRGTVRSIDYHLRLLECKSLESLEQIGNGFFNIISNK